MGIPKCFEFLGCFEVTLILRDYKTVTGKIVGDLSDRKKYEVHKKDDDCDKCDDKKKHHDCDKCDDHKKDVHVSCKPKVDVKVDVDDKCDFILLELTRDAESVSLQEIECENSNIEIEVLNVEFKKGSCIAVNVYDIIYAGVNADLEEVEFEVDVVSCEEEDSSQESATPTA